MFKNTMSILMLRKGRKLTVLCAEESPPTIKTSSDANPKGVISGSATETIPAQICYDAVMQSLI